MYMRIVLLIFIIPVLIQASVRKDIKILESSENIKMYINNLSKDYALLYKFPNKRHIKYAIKKNKNKIYENIQNISELTTDIKSKRLLRFFAYQLSTLDEILKHHPSENRVKEVIDISDSFIEGFDMLSSKYQYNYSYEEKMFTVTRVMIQKIREIEKYYIAMIIFGHTDYIEGKLKQSISYFEKNLDEIDKYIYKNVDIRKKRDRIYSLWSIEKDYISQKSDTKLPMLLEVTSTQISSLLQSLSIYHAKNQ